MGKRASVGIADQRTSIPFGQTILARKRPHFRKPTHLQKSEALTGQTEPRTSRALEHGGAPVALLHHSVIRPPQLNVVRVELDAVQTPA